MSSTRCFPISELSAYTKGWQIRARVTAKAPLRTFNKSKGVSGKVLSVDLLDAEGGEIRASFFNQAADDFYQKLEKGKCFNFSNGNLRVANRQYNTINHRYELVFDKAGVVLEVNDDASIDRVKWNVVDLRAVAAKKLPCTVDLCGVVVTFQSAVSFTSKDGKALVKREICLADHTATSMSVTLWADRAQMEDGFFRGHPVVSLKKVVV